MTNIILDELYALMKNPPPPDVWARFCKYIDPISWVDCWEWQAYKKDGYGHFRLGPTMVSAHRQIALWTFGDFGLLVTDHRWCDNPPCCNVLHLAPTTRQKNTLRGDTLAADCAARTHCPRGHELDGDNLVVAMLKQGKRTCRICWNHYYRERRRPQESKILTATSMATLSTPN